MAETILIVDDDPTQRRLLESVVGRMGYRTRCAGDGREALETLSDRDAAPVNLMLLDLVMPEVDGLTVLKKIRPKLPNLPIIVLTAHGGIDNVVQAMQAGATDFVVKPASPERIEVSIKNALKLNVLTDEISRLQRKQTGAMSFDDMIAGSPRMEEVMKLARRAAQSEIPVLIEGESGVGKELVARAIQGSGGRAGKPFVAVNCGAIPENLVESILFGHEKGAFTGASDKHVGKFQEADGGTLFLDEVGELPLDVQVKLLRAIQEKEIDPVGSKRPVPVDVRIISATNRNLANLVDDNTFREDLFYRLNVFPLTIPPLRERQEDIPELVDHFVQRFAAEEGKQVHAVSGEARDMLIRYPWPGNVRQLENAIFRAVVLAEGDRLTVDDFPQISAHVGVERELVAETVPMAAQAGGRPSLGNVERLPANDRGPRALHENPTGARPPLPPQSAHFDVAILNTEGEFRTLAEVEAEMIALAMEKYNGQMSEIARRLGIGRSTLYRKVRELGLDQNEVR